MRELSRITTFVRFMFVSFGVAVSLSPVFVVVGDARSLIVRGTDVLKEFKREVPPLLYFRDSPFLFSHGTKHKRHFLYFEMTE